MVRPSGKPGQARAGARHDRRPPAPAVALYRRRADTVAIAEQKVAVLQAQINAYRDLSTSLARDEVTVAEDRR